MRLLVILGFVFLLGAGSVHATSADWNTGTLSQGSLSNAFDLEPVAIGNDLTVKLDRGAALTAVVVSGQTRHLAFFLRNPTWITFALCGGLLCVSTRNHRAMRRRAVKSDIPVASPLP